MTPYLGSLSLPVSSSRYRVGTCSFAMPFGYRPIHRRVSSVQSLQSPLIRGSPLSTLETKHDFPSLAPTPPSEACNSRHDLPRNITSQSPHKPLTPAKKARKEGVWSRLWIYELLAAILSLVCIVVIVIVLLYEDGKRLDQWSLAISPNAVVSFIAAFGKSSCVLVLAEAIGQLRWLHFAHAARPLHDLQIFDWASRGPVGGIYLLTRRPLVAALASCASILTIAALFMEPFAQLVVNIDFRPTPSDRVVASISVAKAYDARTRLQGWTEFLMFGSTNLTANVFLGTAEGAPWDLQAAVNSAIFGKVPTFDVECPTSNCSYPQITTVGVCSQCEHMLSAVDVDCYDDSEEHDGCTAEVPDGLLPGLTFTSNATVSNEGSRGGGWMDAWNSSTRQVAPVAMDNNLSAAYSFNGSWKDSYLGFALVPGQPAAVAAFTSIKGLGAFARPATPLGGVHQCTLALCLRTYKNVRVANGKTTAGPFDMTPMVIASNGSTWASWSGQSPAVLNTHSIPPEEVEAAMNALPSPLMFMHAGPGSPNYTMNFQDYLNLGVYMADILNSSLISGVYDNSLTVSGGGNIAPGLFGPAMYKADNLSTLMEDVADAMSNSMRTSQNNITVVNGTAYEMQAYIHIEWKWLAMPVMVTVLSLLLLIIVIIRSHQRGVEAWKSSSFPLLFYGLVGFTAEMEEFENAEDLEQKSRQMSARMLLNSQTRFFVNGIPKGEEGGLAEPL